EDGIRDATVTGVQTCALPISALLARCGRDRCLLRREHGPGLTGAVLQPLQPGVADLHLASPARAGEICGRRPPARSGVGLAGEQIGRASCRERVWVWGVAVWL